MVPALSWALASHWVFATPCTNGTGMTLISAPFCRLRVRWPRSLTSFFSRRAPSIPYRLRIVPRSSVTLRTNRFSSGSRGEASTRMPTQPCRLASASARSSSRVLPIPGGPVNSTELPSGVRRSREIGRPNRSVRVTVWAGFRGVPKTWLIPPACGP